MVFCDTNLKKMILEIMLIFVAKTGLMAAILVGLVFNCRVACSVKETYVTSFLYLFTGWFWLAIMIPRYFISRESLFVVYRRSGCIED